MNDHIATPAMKSLADLRPDSGRGACYQCCFSAGHDLFTQTHLPTMSRNILPDPPEELKPLSQELCARIRNGLDGDGMMPFSAFMEMALYEPGLGYYSAGLHKLGASGDFITSPELGSLFAACLAAQVAETGQILGKYDILEIGAGTGRLAADLLMNLPPDQLPARYLILERSADLREVQRQQLASVPKLSGLVEWLDEPPPKNWQGVLLANEVLDALAVERFQQDKYP